MPLRNGYEPAQMRTGEGAVSSELAQVRGLEAPYRSTRGVSLRELRGTRPPGHRDVRARTVHPRRRGLLPRLRRELLISRTAVSKITDRLWEEYQAFCARDLIEIDVQYLFVDAIVRHEALRNRVG